MILVGSLTATIEDVKEAIVKNFSPLHLNQQAQNHTFSSKSRRQYSRTPQLV
jgi:hypothetical protein